MNTLPEPFVLSPGDRNQPLWLKLKAHWESELERKRRENDAHATEFQTARLRGHIECLKSFLRLDDPPPVMDGN